MSAREKRDEEKRGEKRRRKERERERGSFSEDKGGRRNVECTAASASRSEVNLSGNALGQHVWHSQDPRLLRPSLFRASHD